MFNKTKQLNTSHVKFHILPTGIERWSWGIDCHSVYIHPHLYVCVSPLFWPTLLSCVSCSESHVVNVAGWGQVSAAQVSEWHSYKGCHDFSSEILVLIYIFKPIFFCCLIKSYNVVHVSQQNICKKSVGPELLAVMVIIYFHITLVSLCFEAAYFICWSKLIASSFLNITN